MGVGDGEGTYVCTLSEELQKKAEEELGEVPSRRAQDIQAIRDWLKKQPHINCPTDDWTILRFLRGCKFSLERTKEKMDMFYTCKAACPEWYKNRDPRDPKMREILEMGVVLPLPGYTKDGVKILLGRHGIYEPSKFSADDIMRIYIMITDIMMFEDEPASISGVGIMGDSSGLTFNHTMAWPPTILKKAMVLWQEGYPMRPKGLNYINTPAAFNTVFDIFKGFMKEKMKKRMYVHGSDLESLHKQIPKDILPKEYGGTNGTVEEITKYWLEKVDSKRDWLLQDEQYKVDESKRPGKPKTTGDLFGIEGSFRKLQVD